MSLSINNIGKIDKIKPKEQKPVVENPISQEIAEFSPMPLNHPNKYLVNFKEINTEKSLEERKADLIKIYNDDSLKEKLISCINTDNIDVMEAMANAKRPSGTAIYCAKDLYYTASSVNAENKNTVLKLINQKFPNGIYVNQNLGDILSLVKSLNENNYEFIEKLSDKKNEEGNYIYNATDMIELANNIQEHNKDGMLELLDIENSDGSFPYKSMHELLATALEMQPYNKDFIVWMASIKDKDGTLAYDLSKINMMSLIAASNHQPNIYRLATETTDDGTLAFKNYDLIELNKFLDNHEKNALEYETLFKKFTSPYEANDVNEIIKFETSYNNQFMLGAFKSMEDKKDLMLLKSILNAANSFENEDKKAFWEKYNNEDAFLILKNNINKAKISNEDFNTSVDNLYEKMNEQLDITTSEDVSKIINKLSKEDRELALLLLQKNTQFAGYKSLNVLADQLTKLGVFKFYETSEIGANATLHYIIRRKSNLTCGTKDAFVLDKQGIKYLKELKEKDFNEYSNLINNPKNVFVYIEGWDTGINLNNPEIDLEKTTKSLLEKAKLIKEENPDLTNEEIADKVTNEETEKAIKELDLPNVTKIQNNSINVTPEAISSQLEPIKIEKEILSKKLDTAIKVLADKDNDLEMQYKNVALKYLNYQFKAYSPKKMAAELKAMHQNILKYTDNSMDDVYLYCPKSYLTKSNALIAEQYCNVNNINPSKIIYDKNNIPSDAKNILILDDVVGSGDTYEALYNRIAETNKAQIILSPLSSTEEGMIKLNNKIKELNREDVFICSNIKPEFTKSEFYKNLELSEQILLMSLLNSFEGQEPFGYGNNALSIVFPYMGPDNNSSFASLITENFVISPKVLKNTYENYKVKCEVQQALAK